MLYFSLYYYTKQVEKQVYTDSTEQYNTQVSQLIRMNSSPITVSINNDTNWDEFLAFVTTKDISWYNTIIAKEIDIYKADYMVAYDVNQQFITHTITSYIQSVDFIPKAAMTALNSTGLSKFYMKIPEGYVEVFCAAVHNPLIYIKIKPKLVAISL